MNDTITPIVGYDRYNENDIIFYYRDNDKRKKRIVKCDWYFCVNTNDLNENVRTFLNKVITQKKIKVKTEEVGKYTKIYCNRQISPLFCSIFEKFNIDTFEADLTCTKRYMIDNATNIEDNVNILFFDIETDDSNNGIVIGRDRILSWAACDAESKEIFYYSNDDEAIVIKELLKLFNKYDVIAGWNSKQFDLPYIIERIKANIITDKKGIIVDESHDFWKKLMHIDMMKRFVVLFKQTMSTMGLTRFTLEEVSQVFLGTGKIERPEKVIDLFNNNKEKLKKYNIKDVTLLYELNKKLKVMSLMLKECTWTGTFINKFYISELLDNYILRETQKRNIFLKTKPAWNIERKPEKARGAYVMKPIVGLYDNIRVLDYKSLYPSIIVGWNIGEDAIVKNIVDKTEQNFNDWLDDRKLENVPYIEWVKFLDEQNKKFNPDNKYIQTGNNLFYKKDKQSTIASLIQKLLSERKKYKEIQYNSKYGSLEYDNAYASQYTIKELTNSIYGITADNRTRYFDKRITESITTTGQFLNRTTIHHCENTLKTKVIYADTDSVFIHIDDDKKMNKFVKELNNLISNYLIDRFSIKDDIIIMSYEKKFRKFLMLDKKKYAGHLIEIDGASADNVLTKGTENVRRNITEYSRRHIKKMLELILKHDKTSDFFDKWIDKRRKEIYEDDISPEDITISMRLSKPIDTYTMNSPHVRLAREMIKNNEILDVTEKSKAFGAKIDYVVDNSRSVDKNAIGAIKVNDFEGDWNREYYWDIQIFPPMYKILKIIWPDGVWEEKFSLLYKKKLDEKAKNEMHAYNKKVENEQDKLANKIAKELKI